MPIDNLSKRVIDRRHPEWTANQVRWRWLLDTYEAGEVYRWATYGSDLRGNPRRNLVKHPRECPLPIETNGSNLQSHPEGDAYYSRLIRTEVPDFTQEAIDIHLATIFESEVRREGPDILEDWWKNVDGKGTDIRTFMCDNSGPLFLAMGQINYAMDHPPLPTDAIVKSKADESKYKINSAVASYVLPANLVWWVLDNDDRYTECLACEPQDDGPPCYRHWTAIDWTLYDSQGMVIKTQAHPYGVVPIRPSLFAKSPRSRNVGKCRYETIAHLTHSYYNKNSELTLSDTIQAFPLLQGPEDFCLGNDTIPVGPNSVLPKKKPTSGTVSTYEGWECVEFPKGGADSIRSNLDNIRDAVDRSACLTKPAGSAGTNGSTVSQSGASKQMDANTGNKLLSKIAGVLANAERELAELALIVLTNGKATQADFDSIRIIYPAKFDLQTAEELIGFIQDWHSTCSTAGQTPEFDRRALKMAYRAKLSGLEDEDYDKIDDEIDRFVDFKKADAVKLNESGLTTLSGKPMPMLPVPPDQQTPPATPPDADTESPVSTPKAATKSPKAAKPKK